MVFSQISQFLQVLVFWFFAVQLYEILYNCIDLCDHCHDHVTELFHCHKETPLYYPLLSYFPPVTNPRQ